MPLYFVLDPNLLTLMNRMLFFHVFPGSEPSQFIWTVETSNRKPLQRRRLFTSLTSRSLKTVEEEDEFCVETGESTLSDTVSASPDVATNVNMPDLPVDPEATALNLLSRVEMLEKQVFTLDEKVLQLEKEKEALLARQFSLDKIKDENSAMLFYTGFPNYEALMSFYNYIEPKVSKMQYWKGEKLLKESQPYQMDKNKIKPGPSRSLTYLEEFVLVLLRLEAELFVHDLPDRFGISTSLVSRICITWVHGLFPFPSQELVRKKHTSRVF